MNDYELYHHGILGMKWGVRRFQNKDGSLTSAGKKRYGIKVKVTDHSGEKYLNNNLMISTTPGYRYLDADTNAEARGAVETAELLDKLHKSVSLAELKKDPSLKNKIKKLIGDAIDFVGSLFDTKHKVQQGQKDYEWTEKGKISKAVDTAKDWLNNNVFTTKHTVKNMSGEIISESTTPGWGKKRKG